MLKLFFAPNACSLASHIALNEAAAEFQAIGLNLKTGDQRKPEYLAINPKGRVPALVTPRGTLTENPVILNWVAETFPSAQLKPRGDFFDFSAMQMFNLYLASTIHVTFAHLFRTERYADGAEAIADVRAKVPGSLAVQWRLIEDRLSDGRAWICGDHYTVADCYLYVFARWLARDGTGCSDHFPFTVAHRARMQERPAVVKTLATEGIGPIVEPFASSR